MVRRHGVVGGGGGFGDEVQTEDVDRTAPRAVFDLGKCRNFEGLSADDDVDEEGNSFRALDGYADVGKVNGAAGFEALFARLGFPGQFNSVVSFFSKFSSEVEAHFIFPFG